MMVYYRSRTAVVHLGIVTALLTGGSIWECCHGSAAHPITPIHTRYKTTRLSGLQTAYRLTDVGSAGDADESAAALSSTGEVALNVAGRGSLWRDGRRTSLTVVAGMPDMNVAGINDLGEAVGGVSVTTSGAVTMTSGDAMLWRGGKAISLGCLSGLSDASAVAVNNHGQIAGNSSSSSVIEFQGTSTGVTHAFLWQQGKMTDLGDSAAAALNSRGQIAGSVPFSHAQGNSITSAAHAALWDKGRWHDLGTLPGWTFSAATGINTSGAVTGYCYNGIDPEPSEAFLWMDGKMQDLGPGQALSINAGGQVAGRSGGRAMLWWQGGLCDLTDAVHGAKGWVLTSADAINDRGQIAGFGTDHGQSRAFLLTPLSPLHLVQTHAVPQTARMHLVAAATGSGKITLYWRGVPGATGYNVSRSLSSASNAVRVNRFPVQTLDPGVANGWVFTDRGLTNEASYTYTVAALGSRGREIARSNPSEAAPDPDAPPWDTRDAAKIAAKLWGNSEGIDLPMEDFGPIMPPSPQDFTAPDGIVYKDPGVFVPPSPYRFLVHPAVAYDAVDLGTLGGPSVQPRDISSSGLVVGFAQPAPGPAETRPDLPFLWRNGALEALPIPPSEAPYGFATGVNAAGMVCGYGNVMGRHRAALLWQSGTVRVLPSLPGALQSAAYAVNDTGQVAGDSSDSLDRGHMVWWDALGQIHDVGLGRLASINAAGQMAGTRSGRGQRDHAVRVDGSIMQDLGTLGGPFSQATAINSHGDIAGWSNIAHGSTHGFLYSGGRMINLGLPPNGLSSHADALNDTDEIVGSAATSQGREALIWQNGTLANLNDLTNLPSGVTLTDANSINAQGQICAIGRRGNTTRAYLLTPRHVTQTMP